LHALLQLIDDDLVAFAAVRAGALTPDVLRPLILADWLRMTSFQPGLGNVLWSEPPEDAMARLEREWDRTDVGHVKMTPTGANAMRAMDDPPPALRAFYAGRDGGASDPLQGLAAEVEQEVEAVMSLALVPAGLSTAGRGRPG
jgi:hypothetical protein